MIRFLAFSGRRLWVAVALMTAGFTATPSMAQAPNDRARLIEKGRAILERDCARCHSVGVSGESPLPQAPQFRTLTRKYPLEDLAEPLAEGIVTGHADMPMFVFQTDEIEAILEYLAAINPPHVPPQRPK